MLGAIIQVLLSGFIIGGLARWAVPGPDPMSVPMTILLGVFGSFLGGGVAAAFVGTDQTSGDVFAILDADKEGFLRGQTALIQTIGRAARNVNGTVLMYADKRTEAIQYALDETGRRRAKQLAYNEEHGITPASISKGVSDIAEFLALEAPNVPKRSRRGQKVEGMDQGEIEKLVVTLEEEMYTAAEELRFEYAAKLRDEIKQLRRELLAFDEVATPSP